MVTDDRWRVDLERWAEAVNAGDLERVGQVADELFTSKVIYHPGASKRPPGREEVERILPRHPNLCIDIQDAFASGDKVAIRSNLRWTDQATGQPKERMDLVIWRFEGRKVAEWWEATAELDPD